jgi:uncharacterized protein DUF669
MTQSTFGALMAQAAQSGATFEVLEAGMYIAKVIESEARTSSTGKPQIKTRWEVTHGPKAGYKGLWLYLTLTTDNPNALGIFYRQLTAMGITAEFLQSLSNLDPETATKHIAQALLNATAQLKVKIDTEFSNNKVERVNPIPPEAAQFVNTPTADPFAQAAAATPAASAPPAPAAVPVPDGPAAPPPPF